MAAPTGIDSLPQHILAEIASFFNDVEFQRPLLATVSRQWQLAVEPLTFRSIRLQSSETEYFQNTILKQSHRRPFINRFDFTIILPRYPDESKFRFESESEKTANTEAFTAAIQDLFAILHGCDINRDGSIDLRIVDAYSPSDHEPFVERLPPASDTPTISFHGIELGPMRHSYSQLQLLTTDLPMIPVVKHFFVAAQHRSISPRAVMGMVTKFSNLQTFKMRTRDQETRYPEFREDFRTDFANAIPINSTALSGLRSFHLNMIDPEFCESTVGRAGRSPNYKVDRLSDSIRSMTTPLHDLRELSLRGVFDEWLLWPGPKAALSEPYWQNLERLAVEFFTARPTGGYFYRLKTSRAATRPTTNTPPPLETMSSDDDEWLPVEPFTEDRRGHHPTTRTLHAVPMDDTLEPLMESFARACLQIPTLKTAFLGTAVPLDPLDEDTAEEEAETYTKSFWGVIYMSPRARPFKTPILLNYAFRQNREQRRLVWVTDKWIPSDHVHDLFLGIGKEMHGGAMLEQFLETRAIPWGSRTPGPNDA